VSRAVVSNPLTAAPGLLLGNPLDERDDGPSEFRACDAIEGHAECEAVSRRHKFCDIFWERCPPGCRIGSLLVRCALKEKPDWYLENAGDLLKAAGPNAIGAFFVFLNLLEGQSQASAKFRLAERQHLAAHPHLTADMAVYGVRGLFPHSFTLRRGAGLGKLSGSSQVDEDSAVGEYLRFEMTNEPFKFKGLTGPFIVDDSSCGLGSRLLRRNWLIRLFLFAHCPRIRNVQTSQSQ
jgi:hypothetical protein